MAAGIRFSGRGQGNRFWQESGMRILKTGAGFYGNQEIFLPLQTEKKKKEGGRHKL